MGVPVRNLVALVFITASLPAAAGLLCYWCSGVGNDRECELRPDAVSTGPVFINCRQNHCVSTKVIDVATGRVQSFARFCDRVPRGNVCVRDSKLVTCYESCKDDLCNHGNPDPAYLPLVSYASYDVIARYSEHRVPSNGNDHVGNRIMSAAAARQKIGWYGDENAESAASTRSRPFERPQLWREEEEHGGNALQVAPKASPTERVESVFEPEHISSGRSTMGSSTGFGSSKVRGQVFPTTEERPGGRGNSVLIEEDAEEGTRSFDSSHGSPYRPPRYWSSNSRRFSRPFTRPQQTSPTSKDNNEGSFQATTSGQTTTGQGAGFTKSNYFQGANSAVNAVEKADENKLQNLSKDGAITTATEQIHRMMTRRPFVERKRNKNRRLKVAASRRRPERVQAPKSNGIEKSTSHLESFNKHTESRLPTEANKLMTPASTSASTTTTTTSTTSATTSTTSATTDTTTTSTQVSTLTTRKANVAPTDFHTTTSTNKDKKTSIPTSASTPVSPDAHTSKTESSSHKGFRSPYAPPEKDSNRYQVGGQRAAPQATDNKKTPGKANFKKAASTQEKIVVPAPSPSSTSRGGKLPGRKAQSTTRLTTAEQKTTVSMTSPSEPSTAKAVRPRKQNVPSPTTTTVKTTTQTVTTTTQPTTPSTIPTTTLFPVLHGFDIKGPHEYEEMARMKPWVRPLFRDLGSMLSQKALKVGEHKKEVEVNLPNSPAGKSVFLTGGDSKTHWDTKPSQSAAASSDKTTTSSSEPEANSKASTGHAKATSPLHPSSQAVTTQTTSKTQNVPEVQTTAQERPRDVVKAKDNTKDNSRNDNTIQKHEQVKNDGKVEASKTPSIITHPVPSKPKHSPKINENQANRDFVQNPVSRRDPGDKDIKTVTSRVIPTNPIDWQFYRKDLVGESKNASAPLKRLQSHQSPETGVWYSGYSPTARFDGWTPHSHTREDTVTSTKPGFQKAESEKTPDTSAVTGKDQHAEKKAAAEQAPKSGKVGNSDSSIITHPVRNINTTPTGGTSKSTTVTSTKSTTTEEAKVNKDNKNEKKPEQKGNQLSTKSPQAKKAETNTVSDKKDPPTHAKKDVKATADMKKGDHKDSSAKSDRKGKKSPFKPGRHYKRPRKVVHRGEKPKPTFQATTENKMETTASMTSVPGPVRTTKTTPRQVHDKDFFRTSSGTAYPPRGPGQDSQLKSLPILLTLDTKNDAKGSTSAKPQAGLQSQSADEKTFKKTEMKSPFAPPSKELDVMAQRRATERTFVGTKVGIDNSRMSPSPATKKESSSAASVSKENQRPSVQTSTASGKISSSKGAKTETAATTKSMNDNKSSTGKSLATSTSAAVSDAPKDKAVPVEKALKSPYERPTWTTQYDFTVSATKTAATKPGPQKTSSASSQNTFTATTTEAKIPTPVTAIQASRAGSTSKSDRKTVTLPFSPNLDWQKQKTTSAHTHQVKTTPSSRTDAQPRSVTPKVLVSKKQRPGVDLTHLHDDEREEVLRLIPNLKDDAIIWPREPKDVEERIISKVIVEEDAEEVLHQALPRKSAQGSESRSGSRLEESADQWAPSSQGLSGAKEGEAEAEQGKGDASLRPSSADPSNGQPPLFTGTVNTTLELENTRQHSPAGDSSEKSPFDFSSASSLRFLWSLLALSLAVLVLL